MKTYSICLNLFFPSIEFGWLAAEVETGRRGRRRSRLDPQPRPTITLPPRSGSMETLFNGGFSPGPMTLLSGFLGDGDDGKSFSQLLAGAMSSPVAGRRRSDGLT
ncbi:Putative WRKY transcription factor 4 [Glycine soja]|uniref:Putative WRKY transcription factor 4 n=1 Tax=Glycine soja TaxID=3848 RepID=A0A0B2RZX7_GLYSO|nr:Putative WRKY transcription factor 4 [Glycine soja]